MMDRSPCCFHSCRSTKWFGLECEPFIFGDVSYIISFSRRGPCRGSEVVFELYTRKSDYFIRVLWGGQPMKTSTPLKTLDMTPLEDFFACT